MVALFWIILPLHGLLFVPFYYAIKRWPGGDDGPGLAWLLFIGGGACVAGILAAVLAITGIIITERRKKETEQTGVDCQK